MNSLPEPYLSVIVPLFNEAGGLQTFAKRLRTVLDDLGITYEVIFVDDGSTDLTPQIAQSLDWVELRVAVLAQNTGHQSALEAGLSLARGSWLLTMDGDGQHPPDVIPLMMAAISTQSVDIVYTKRTSRNDESLAKKHSALLYYRLMRWLTEVPISDSQADFRLMNRRVLNELRQIPGERVLRLLLPSIGFRSTVLEYTAQSRIDGKSRYGVGRQVQLAMTSALNFSTKPLKMIALVGLVVSTAAALWLAAVLIAFLRGQNVTGWTSVMSATLLVGGLTLLSLSVIGAYIARIHDLLKNHPRYAIHSVSSIRMQDQGTSSYDEID